MTANWKFLDWRNRQDSVFNQELDESSDCESGPISFPDENTPVKFVFEASLNDVVKMLSALEKGAQLSYPDDWHEVWWLFVRNLECEVPICDEVAECIEFDEGTQAAIAAAIAGSAIIQQAINDTFNPDIPGDSASESYRAQNAYSTALGCNNDDGWGHIRDGLVERAFQRVRDVLDQIELTTDNQEMLAATLEAMPVFGVTLKAVGVSGIIAWFDNVRGFLADAWDAGDTLTKRDQVACDLFCIWQADCSLSFDQISEYFYQNAIDNFPTYENAFTDIAALLLAMSDPTELTGEFVVDCLLGTMFGFQSFVNDWFGVTIASVSNDMLFGEPSDDWTVACPDCPTEGWSHTFSDADGWGDWTIDTTTGSGPQGQFVTGGIESLSFVLAGSNTTGINVFNSTPLPDIYSIHIVLDFAAGSGIPGWNYYDDTGIAGLSGMVDGTDVDGNASDVGPSPSSGVGLQLLSQFGGTTTGNVFLKSITISSDFGTDPY